MPYIPQIKLKDGMLDIGIDAVRLNGKDPSYYLDYNNFTNVPSSIGTLDSSMSDTSTSAVQNKVIKKYVDDSIANAITSALSASY